MGRMAPPPTFTPGDPAPWFKARTEGNPGYDFSTVAGRTIVLFLFGASSEPTARAALDGFLARRAAFDDDRMAFFGVTVDPLDERERRVANGIPGVRFFFDDDRAVSGLFGACDEGEDGRLVYRPFTLVLDDRLRVLAQVPLAKGEDHAARVMAIAEAQPAPEASRPARGQAPVLLVPRIFERAFCAELIAYYEAHGGEDSGSCARRAARPSRSPTTASSGARIAPSTTSACAEAR
jgi:peroxiredoxin